MARMLNVAILLLSRKDITQYVRIVEFGRGDHDFYIYDRELPGLEWGRNASVEDRTDRQRGTIDIAAVEAVLNHSEGVQKLHFGGSEVDFLERFRLDLHFHAAIATPIDGTEGDTGCLRVADFHNFVDSSDEGNGYDLNEQFYMEFARAATLTNLVFLDLTWTNINCETLITLLRRAPTLLHLGFGHHPICENHFDDYASKEVLGTIRKSCRRLTSLLICVPTTPLQIQHGAHISELASGGIQSKLPRTIRFLSLSGPQNRRTRYVPPHPIIAAPPNSFPPLIL
ncbi:hypothetical protein HDV00_000216 [Rhizophlyctis rosea]|nr:hypothetical protein HDV00_000216 [Rhizophlyctis rosea]